MSKETILLIGGLGFIGAQVSRRLLQMGHNVVVLDAFINYTSPFKSAFDYGKGVRDRFKGIEDQIKLIRGDAKYYPLLDRTIREHRPARIVHFGSMPISTLSNTLIGEAIDSTINATSNILEAAKNFDFVERFVYISSSMIYGDFVEIPAPEDHPKNPKGIYGGAKLCGEIMTRAYTRGFGINHTIIRPSAVYGPTDMNKRISQIIVENAAAGKPTTLRGADITKLDFTHVHDIAYGIVLAMFSENGKNETFNITSGNAYSLREYADIVRRYYPNMEIIFEDVDKSIPLRGTLSIEKAKKLLGYEPQYTLEQGIKEYIEYTKRILGE